MVVISNILTIRDILEFKAGLDKIIHTDTVGNILVVLNVRI